MTEIKIKFEAIGTEETVGDICYNFHENYPEFAGNMEEIDYAYDEDTMEFMLLWAGQFEDGQLDEYDMEVLMKLTHHAEGFYDETDAEYVHVEVCVDNEWHGQRGDNA